MKNLRDLVKFRDSVEYRPMFRTIIKCQIQALIMQLANAGEESLLLTACTMDTVPDSDTIGSELGQTFLQDCPDYPVVFRDFCFQKTRHKDIESEPSIKRKEMETNGEQNTDESASNEGFVSEGKKVKIERASSPESGADTRESTSDASVKKDQCHFNLGGIGTSFSSPYHTGPGMLGQNQWSPSLSNSSTKNQHKCSQCNYASKFKANVVRHERSIHGINVEGSPGPTIQYACTLCAYKSLYRSNLMRHEKNIHKIEPSMPDVGDISHLGMPGAGGDARPIMPVMSNADSAKSLENDQLSEGTTQMNKDLEDTENSQDTVNNCHVCAFCQLIFPSLQLLKEHVDQTHYGKGGKYDCGKCRTSFSNLLLFQNHMANHYTQRQENCVCGRTFQYRVSLLKHIPKCVIAKETNFKMSDIVLGSGLDMENAHARTELEQGSSQNDIEQGMMGKFVVGTNMSTEQVPVQGDHKQEVGQGTSGLSVQGKDTELGTSQQETGYQLPLTIKQENEFENMLYLQPNMPETSNHQVTHSN